MLIKIEAHTGIEYVNPWQITHVTAMRGYMLIHLTNQAMLPIALEEWPRIEPMLVKEQSPRGASADDDKPSSTDDYGGF
jgi:hypothetical protein